MADGAPGKLRDKYGQSGAKILRSLAAQGYFRDAKALKELQQDPDFAALRKRADVAALTDELTAAGTPAGLATDEK